MTIVLIFLGLFVLGVPIAIALAAAGLLGLYASPDGALLVSAVPEQVFQSLNSFPFLTIPLFILAGTIMAEGGVASRLMALAQITVGRGRGGLGAAIVVATMFFSGISGSSTADTAAVGKVTLPTLRQQGYPVPFSTALLAAAGASATLIPPSIDMIIIGVVANMSIAGLFAAGLIPAIINGLGLMLMVVYLARRGGYGVGSGRVTFGQAARTLVQAVPALFMIVIILGGILFGVFTPTEASAVAVMYGLLLATVVNRELPLRRLPRVLMETVEISGIVLFMIAMGAVLGYTMTILEIPGRLAEQIHAIAGNRAVFLLLVQTLFFFIGMIMDTVPALLILMPILTPMAVSYGIEPIHFGILVEANVGLGLVTPPVGVCLYAACALTRLPLERVIRPLLPFIGILVVTLFVITYVEGFSMYLPRALGLTD
jgi:tripartite ATP-independent transporter DctM subunit